jgi:hypothetical protein
LSAENWYNPAPARSAGTKVANIIVAVISARIPNSPAGSAAPAATHSDARYSAADSPLNRVSAPDAARHHSGT